MSASPAAKLPGARIFAWAGAAVFAASLLYFLLSYVITFGEARFGTPQLLPIALNTALFSAFALHHSLFARTPVRAVVARLVPRGLERSFYVWVASLLFIVVCAAWQPVAGIAWHVEGPAEWALRALQFIGVSLTLHSARVIDIWDLAGVRQTADGAAEFKAEGPYAWVRHPIYLGWLLIVFPVGTMTMTRLVFAVVSSVYLLIAIPLEERTLRATTGGAYDAYIGRVRWKLVPGVY